MILSASEVAALAASLGAGVVAGLCSTFGAFVLGALDDLGPAAAIRAMQSINARILRSSAMVVWFGTVALAIGAAFLAGGTALTVVGAASYTFGAVAVTGLGNVPLNEALDQVAPTGSEAEGAWRRYRTRWARWNALRTLACVVAAGCFALAA